MRPAVDNVLAAVVSGMDRELGSLPPGPDWLKLWGMKGMLSIVQRDWDDAASLRSNEITELAALLGKAAPICPQALGSRLLQAVAHAECQWHDLRVSALERTLDGLRQALIDLQSWLETSDQDDAPVLMSECWSFLVRANRRRLVVMQPW